MGGDIWDRDGLSTPLVRKPSDSFLPRMNVESPSLSQISPPSLVKYSTVTPYHYNLRTHHTPGFTHRWSSTPLSQTDTEGPPHLTKAFSSPAVIGSDIQENILNFEKRLEVLEENEVDSGFESLIQSIDESSVSGSTSKEEPRLVGGELTEKITASPSLTGDRNHGAIPKRRSPRFKQKPETDRLGRLRSGSRSAKRLEVSRSEVSSVVRVSRTDRTGREVCDVLRYLWQMNLSSDVLETLFGFLSPPDLCSVTQVSSHWRQALQSVPSHNDRRLAFVSKMKIERENVGVENLRPKRISPRRVMQDTSNRISPTASKRDRNRSVSTVISPSKVRHKLFVEEASKLTAGERLVACPECTSPSRVTLSQTSGQRAECSSPQCQFVFCPECKCDPHPNQSCRQARPSSRVPKTGGITSKKSKARLRRL